ncbi:IS110 family transposase [Novosphingobium sp. 1949]|uniref:IS110 family transposase n=1 Tax=Novosphingobium organovorum TaxID=2930092 RepID=A0ABT0BI33_9SPHN|nr:IS110 family transposase [Novosphingobium organovorum]MCJ2184590.1 IS110 family transposase [Novosphingobium organovorum]
MKPYAGLDVSQHSTSICIVDEIGDIIVERKVPTCPDAIAAALKPFDLSRAGLETGPLSVWLWNELSAAGVPIICMDARHANAALKMMPAKTDRNDAAGLAQIVRTGWCKRVHVKSTPGHEARALLAARSPLVQIRCDLENEIRGVLRTFGILFGKRVGGFAKRAEEIASGELDASLMSRVVVEALMKARHDAAAQVSALDVRVRSSSRGNPVVRHLMTVPGVGAITAPGGVATIDDPTRFRRSASAGAYLGLTPKIYASDETMKVGRISRRGDDFLRRSLYEAAHALLTRVSHPSSLKAWGLRIAKRSGFKRAKVAVTRKLAVILHALWLSGEEFRWSSNTPQRPLAG